LNRYSARQPMRRWEWGYFIVGVYENYVGMWMTLRATITLRCAMIQVILWHG
jgi:hypothetical protein